MRLLLDTLFYLCRLSRQTSNSYQRFISRYDYFQTINIEVMKRMSANTTYKLHNRSFHSISAQRRTLHSKTHANLRQQKYQYNQRLFRKNTISVTSQVIQCGYVTGSVQRHLTEIESGMQITDGRKDRSVRSVACFLTVHFRFKAGAKHKIPHVIDTGNTFVENAEIRNGEIQLQQACKLSSRYSYL